jgi:hypothetical protein
MLITVLTHIQEQNPIDVIFLNKKFGVLQLWCFITFLFFVMMFLSLTTLQSTNTYVRAMDRNPNFFLKSFWNISYHQPFLIANFY